MHKHRSAIGAILLVGSVLSASAEHAAAQSHDAAAEIPRDPESTMRARQSYQLPDGGAVQHEQYEGLIRTVDANGKEVARAKVPAARMISRSTTLVFSSDLSRILMVHTTDDFDFRTRHRVAILDTARLQTLAEPPLGKCSTPGPFPLAAGQLTMICYHSRPPGDAAQKPTLALVTVDIGKAQVIRWFPLGGKRKGTWFGPMFLGWTYDVRTVPMRPGTHASCSSFDGALGGVPPGKREKPDLVVVLNKDDGPPHGEVWTVSPEATAPRRVAVLRDKADHAVLCDAATIEPGAGGPARLLYVFGERHLGSGQNAAGSRGASAQRIDVIDTATGRLLGHWTR